MGWRSIRLWLKFVFFLVTTKLRFSEMRVLNPSPTTAPPSTVRLYSRGLSAYVRITNTTIDARRSNSEKDPDTLIEIESRGAPGQVVIKSKTNGRYVCFDKNSVVKILVSYVPDCLFKEKTNRKRYITFQSVSNNTWYLGFSNRKANFGMPKQGRKTMAGQRSIMFVKKLPS